MDTMDNNEGAKKRSPLWTKEEIENDPNKGNYVGPALCCLGDALICSACITAALAVTVCCSHIVVGKAVKSAVDDPESNKSSV
jgi:hypothetical protein